MSEPLNEFLEIVEAYAMNFSNSDESLGKLVREQWITMKQKEDRAGASVHTIPDADGNPVRVAIPKEWPNDR